MKINSFITMVMVALVMTNCSQNENLNEIIQDGFTEFIAGVEGQSRSTMTDAGKFSWTKGDRLSIWNGRTFTTFTCTNGNTFTGDPITPLNYAIYPAGDHDISGNNVTVKLRSSYGDINTDYVENTNAIMLASVQPGNNNLTFKHLGGLMRFNIKNVPAGSNKFVFSASDKSITGDFTVEGNTIKAGTNSDDNTVTICFKSLSSAKDMTFYIPLPIGTYNGFKIEIQGNSTLTYTTRARNTVNRRTLLLMPAFECKNGSLVKEGSATIDFSNSSTTTTVATESVEVNTATAGGNNTSMTLNYDPSSNPILNLYDDSKGGVTQDSKATVEVEVPANSTVDVLTVDAPTLTVELSAKNGTATYETVTAKTAANTLRINNGITVNRLILNGGHIVVEQGAIVKQIVNADGYSEKTYIVKKGTITNTPSLSNVVIVTDEKEIEQDYVLRVLTFEDKDAKFESYYLDYAYDYAGKEITTWSDLIDDPQYYGPLTYGNDQMDAMYTWWDENNTELMHTFPDNYAYCFWGGGHAVSNYVGEGYSDEDRNKHIAQYYGQDYVDTWEGQPGADAYLGWFNVQMMIPVQAHSGSNFAVHYGYKDTQSYIENLPEISFADGEARVIDHMYVVNTNYTLNQLFNGVKSEEGNAFGGNWEGLTDEAWLKIVAQGFDDVDADAYAEPISEVEFYLVYGKNVVTDWQKWDLSGLGEVAKVRFNFLYSEEMGGRYGFTIPGYFAYDDIAVRFKE